jgi:hypothetical protein
VTRALLALVFLPLIGGCYTPAWRVAQIHEEIEAANAPRRDEAVKDALEANRAILLNAVPKTVVFRSDMNQCGAAMAVVEIENDVFVAPCNGLRNAVLAGGAVKIESEDGTVTRVLAAATPLAGDSSSNFVLANGPNGEIFLIRPRMTVVHKRKIWQKGTCNYMPSPVQLSSSASMFVLPPAQVKAIDVTYEGDDTEVICDRRVE